MSGVVDYYWIRKQGMFFFVDHYKVWDSVLKAE